MKILLVLLVLLGLSALLLLLLPLSAGPADVGMLQGRRCFGCDSLGNNW